MEQTGVSRARSSARDAADGLPFADGEFDLVYCSSVIEHVPPAEAGGLRARTAAGRSRLVRADARLLFPIEPHALLPAVHWLPAGVRRPFWRLGATGGWEEISLLRRGELEALFGPARPERFAGLVDWISVRPCRWGPALSDAASASRLRAS